MADVPAVSVIMPTRALPARGHLLRRAVDSVLAQTAVRAIPLLVVNGPDRDEALCASLRADGRCRVVMLERADLPEALRVGRTHVDTPWFSELDDDDEYFPDALTRRLEALRNAEVPVVVTNGIRRDVAGDHLQVDDAAGVRHDPLRALLTRHWLMPGSYLCQTDAVGEELFLGMPPYLENTYLAVRFALGYRFVFVDQPTLVRHLDTPHSESKSIAYLAGQVDALRCLIELDLPADVRTTFQGRIAAACHSVSARLLRDGRIGPAWRWHVRSLVRPGGWRFLPYSRRLILPRWYAE